MDRLVGCGERAVGGEHVPRARHGDRQDAELEVPREHEASLLERAEPPVEAAGPFGGDPEVGAPAEHRLRGLQAADGALAVLAVDGDEPGPAHRATENGDAKELLLRHHTEVAPEHVVEHRNVVVRLVVRHHHERLSGGHVVAAGHGDRHPCALHDAVAPSGEALVARRLRHATGGRLEHGRRTDGERLVHAHQGEAKGAGHAQVPG